jgi:hypothetical protein
MCALDQPVAATMPLLNSGAALLLIALSSVRSILTTLLFVRYVTFVVICR